MNCSCAYRSTRLDNKRPNRNELLAVSATDSSRLICMTKAAGGYSTTVTHAKWDAQRSRLTRSSLMRIRWMAAAEAANCGDGARKLCTEESRCIRPANNGSMQQCKAITGRVSCGNTARTTTQDIRANPVPSRLLLYSYLRRRLASESIVPLGVTLARCTCVRRAAYITYRLHAALFSAAKVMRCIQCSLV